MSDPEKIVCKPTHWFLFRAGVMVVMFSVFAFLFYKDGAIGYRRENATLFLRMAFETAANDYQAHAAKGPISPTEWRKYAETKTVSFVWGGAPIGAAELPKEVQPGMAWPEPLRDAELLKSTQWSRLWEDYSAKWPAWKMDSIPPHKAHDADAIAQQWIVFYICAALAATALFFFVRTLGRSMAVDQEALYTQTGKRIPFGDLKRLDLRKWDTKGLAFADYQGAAGSGRARLDGMTYGGFKKEQGEPAERLMQRIRAHFAGELVEYVAADSGPADPPPAES